MDINARIARMKEHKKLFGIDSDTFQPYFIEAKTISFSEKTKNYKKWKENFFKKWHGNKVKETLIEVKDGKKTIGTIRHLLNEDTNETASAIHPAEGIKRTFVEYDSTRYRKLFT